MAIIKPEGLFNGDRLRRCSDRAKLWWPWLFLASNGYARIEIQPARIIGDVFRGFETKPTEVEIADVFAEYHNAHLVFLYSRGGQLWAQFDCPKECLKRHKTAADERSPSPPKEAYEQWLREYQESKEQSKAEPVNKLRALVFPAEISPPDFGKVAEISRRGVGVGGGVGEGEGKTLSQDRPATAKDSRYDGFVEDLCAYWKHKNPNVKFAMTGKDGKNLKQLLRDYPERVLSRAEFQVCLNHRARDQSVRSHAEAIYRWILRVREWASGPHKQNGFTVVTKRQTIAERNAEAARRAIDSHAATDSGLLPVGAKPGGS